MTRPTLEEYKEIGNEFRSLRPYLVHMLVDLSSVFGTTAIKPLNSSINRLERTRDKLNERLSRNYLSCDYNDYFYGDLENKERKTIEFRNKKHTELTFEEYQMIGKVIKDAEKTYMKLALKSCRLHGKTVVRSMLDADSNFSTLRSNLEIIMCRDLKNKPHAELLDVFY